MKRQFSAGIIPFFKRDTTIEYLLLHTASRHWDFPKGKIEPGESKQVAALRELKEESGVVADIIPGFEHAISYFFREREGLLISKTVYFFIGHAQHDAVTLSHEHTQFAWLPYGQALERISYKNSQEALRLAHHFIGSHNH